METIKKNIIKLSASPPYPCVEDEDYGISIMIIKDKNNKINFLEDDLCFETTNSESGFVRGYMSSTHYEESNFFLYKIERQGPITITISANENIELSGLYFTLHNRSEYYEI